MRKNAFTDALRGIQDSYSSEWNARFHLFATVVVIAVGAWLEIRPVDWVLVLIASCLVLITEMLNTSIEKLCDHLHPEKHEMIRKVKDISAGAVLISVVVSIVIGVIVFFPYFEKLLS